jgi:hypothetical protein
VEKLLCLLIEVLVWNMPGRTDKNHKLPQLGYPMLRPGFEMYEFRGSLIYLSALLNISYYHDLRVTEDVVWIGNWG